RPRPWSGAASPCAAPARATRTRGRCRPARRRDRGGWPSAPPGTRNRPCYPPTRRRGGGRGASAAEDAAAVGAAGIGPAVVVAEEDRPHPVDHRVEGAAPVAVRLPALVAQTHLDVLDLEAEVVEVGDVLDAVALVVDHDHVVVEHVLDVEAGGAVALAVAVVVDQVVVVPA